MKKIFIEGIPVVAGTKAEKIALNFQKWLKTRRLKGVCYRTGMKCGAWSLDVYIIPEKEEKPFFQKKCKGDHIISQEYGYFVSGDNNRIINKVINYMISTQVDEVIYDFLDYFTTCNDIEIKKGISIEEQFGEDNAVINQDFKIFCEENNLNDAEYRFYLDQFYKFIP